MYNLLTYLNEFESNAAMHNLMDDPMMQMARWAIVGRLTASLFHEINNPLQAVRGAASLGLEELDDPDALRLYLELTLRETERVVNLIERARQVYRPERQQREPVDVVHVLHEALLLTRKEMERKGVQVELLLAENLPPITAVASEILLAILCPLLQFSDALAAVPDSILQLYAQWVGDVIVIELKSTDTQLPKAGFFLILCPRIVAAYGGTVSQMQREAEAVIEIRLPAA